MAYLVGLSRQRVNEALNTLQAQGFIRIEYGGLRVLDLGALRSSVFSSKNELLLNTRKDK
jgi:CRP/FNR family cyclic AMP-dependent transcriptional regulator